MSELKPCPFCGCPKLKLHVKEFAGLKIKLRFVECDRCGACGPPHMDLEENQEEDFWNRRVP